MTGRTLPKTLLLAALLVAGPAAGQVGTDIFLLDVAALAHDQLALVRVTDTPGYDNQPHFSPDGQILYFTRMVDGQTDIYGYTLRHASISALLESPQSEYSATPVPLKYAVSVIRVEDDGRQRLWLLPLNGEPPELVFENIEPVGYQAWAAPRIALLFVLGETMTLQLVGPAGVGLEIAQNIGRALVPVPDSTSVAYVQKDESKRWVINTYDYATDEHRFLATTMGQREDFTIAPDGSLWMGDGPRLYQWTREKPQWTLRADLADQGLLEISRLAASPDGRLLAIVTDEAPAPLEPPPRPPTPMTDDDGQKDL